MNILMIAIALLLVLYLARKQIGNLIGSLKGYGTCPNCNGSWMFRKASSVPYGGTNCVGGASVQWGVMICKSCLKSPAKLNAEKIRKGLISCGWKPEKINLAMSAVRFLKAGSLAVHSA